MRIQANDMLAAADEASGLLKALANRHRLIIICQLIEKERSVGELAALLKIRHSTVSQHLALLRKDGLVTARRDGQIIWYSISSPQARALVRAAPLTNMSRGSEARVQFALMAPFDVRRDATFLAIGAIADVPSTSLNRCS
jgi:DNA-binding transcriptional ArsR family regulator